MGSFGYPMMSPLWWRYGGLSWDHVKAVLAAYEAGGTRHFLYIAALLTRSRNGFARCRQMHVFAAARDLQGLNTTASIKNALKHH